MLNFAGLFRFDGGPVATSQLDRLAAHLGGRNFEAPTIWRAASLGIVMRRLPLREEERLAAPPFTARAGSLIVVGSARIDNRADLISQLALDSRHAWHDCEIVAAAFDRWEEGAADRLRGDFGFVAVDLRKRQVTLASDCFGHFPLFYHRGKDFIAFATRPAALLALDGVARTLSDDGIADILAGNMTDRGATVYQAVRRVERASQVIHDRSGARTEVYWQPKPQPLLQLARNEDYVEAARDVLKDVLTGHLRAQRPIGVMLSGGLDSSALAATLAMLAPDRQILGFTTIPDDTAENAFPSEQPFVRLLAARYPNLDVTYVSQKSITPLDPRWRESFNAVGLPFAGMPLAARRLALIDAAAEKDVGVMMTGDGGNLTFTREGTELFAELAMSGRWATLLKEIRAAAAKTDESSAAIFRSQVLREIMPRWLLSMYGHLRGWDRSATPPESFLRAELAGDIGLEARWSRAGLHRGNQHVLRRRDFEIAMLQFLQPPWAEAYTLEYHRSGIEQATPLRDRRMVDFMLSVPAEQFMRNGVTRWLARRALADRLPGEVANRTAFIRSFEDLFPWLATWHGKAAIKLEQLEQSTAVRRSMDIPRLKRTLAEGPPKSFDQVRGRTQEFTQFLPDAMHIGDFIRWHEGSNR
jgi:asparagine synthase (glutamine-hydrolysing)